MEPDIKDGMEGYLQRILRARVYEVAQETPLEPARHLSARLGHNVLLKREDLQPVFSFKLRGAFNRMAQLPAEQLKRGVIAASAGNHAQGVALSARQLGCSAVIVMPLTTPRTKVEAVRHLGAEVVLHGDTFDEAQARARALEQERHLCFIHPFDDPEVIAGQGTIGLEILRQCSEPPDAIYLAVGGGGLISGVGAYVKALWPGVQIIGVEPVDADAMTRSLAAGERVRLEQVGLFADGVAVREVGEETFRLAQQVVDRMVTVDSDAICAAIKDVFEDTRSILEPAGALAVAGLKADAANWSSGSQLVAVACGANMNFERLRFVAERAALGEEREAMLAVEIPEQPGSLRRFCRLLGSHNLTEFSYRMASGGSKAHIFVGVEISDRADAGKLMADLEAGGFACVDLSGNELAKLHLRHMVGGRQPLEAQTDVTTAEKLYRFEFPERPGALMAFVDALHPGWSISIFHYRNQGSDVGRIVVGVQVPKAEMEHWQTFLARLPFPSWDESDNPAYRLFLA